MKRTKPVKKKLSPDWTLAEKKQNTTLSYLYQHLFAIYIYIFIYLFIGLYWLPFQIWSSPCGLSFWVPPLVGWDDANALAWIGLLLQHLPVRRDHTSPREGKKHFKKTTGCEYT